MRKAAASSLESDSLSETDEHTEPVVARKSMIAKANRKPKFKVRAKSRCKRCGRSRAYYRKFGVCRICLRELAHAGELPGVVKSSW